MHKNMTEQTAPLSLDQQFEAWLKERNATVAIVAVTPVTRERIGLINLMALNWPIEVHIVPNQEQAQ